MKRVQAFAAMSICLGLWTIPAGATPPVGNYPERTITLVVPWPAGGFTDRLGRMMADKMSASLGQTVIVENRPGASAGIGSEHVMRAAPDGYTLLVTSTDGTVKLLHGQGPDPVTQFTQISMRASQPVTLSVGPKFKGNTLAQFVEAAKANPGSIAFASNGEGGATHYGMEMFAKQAGIKLNHIPYKGTSPALNDLIGGQVESTLVSLQGIGSYLESGRARALAITSAKRAAAAPDVPTFAESGYPDFDLTLWYGMVGPKGMPEAIVSKLNQSVKAAISATDVQQKLRSAAAEPLSSSPEEMLSFVRKEGTRWTSMIQ